uniref:Uncharacterized protein n=1 Tax=Rhizophora mucronata TaxID=61149 RepID=A0A2P2PEC9_RHIMU
MFNIIYQRGDISYMGQSLRVFLQRPLVSKDRMHGTGEAKQQDRWLPCF